MAFRCDSCLFTYDNIGLLRDHLLNMFSSSSSSHSVHAFVCPLCCAPPQQFGGTSTFAGAQAFADHIGTIHANVSASADAILLSQSGPTTFASSSYADAAAPSAATAVRKRTNEAVTHCMHCARPFKRAWDLQRHMRTHTDERPFVCDTCGRRFRLRTTLTDHWRTHQESDTHACQFQCSECAKRFLSRSALKLHMRAHTGEAPFACDASPFCTRTFRTKKLMLSHHRNDHEQNSDQHQLMADEGEEEEEEEEANAMDRHHRHIDRDAQIAFVALARLNGRTIKGGIGTAGGSANTAISRSEGSAFSDFKRLHQQRHRHQLQPSMQQCPAAVDIQKQQETNNVLQSTEMVLVTQASAGDSSLSSAGVVGVHPQQRLPLSNPTAIGDDEILSNNNAADYCCWPNTKFNSNNNNRTMIQHHHPGHQHHHQHSSSSSASVSMPAVGAAGVPSLFVHRQPQQQGVFTTSGATRTVARPFPTASDSIAATATIMPASAPGMTGAAARQLLAQSCMPSL